MTFRYTNYKGEVYYLHKGTGKKGGSQYSFSMKKARTPVESVPEGDFKMERVDFADSDDKWWLLEDGKGLEKLAKKYCRHLGKDSFYDLI